MYPRPFATNAAFPERINPNARLVLHIFIGSKLALRTNTGAIAWNSILGGIIA